jgi:5-formyltetrahydrofolate cyclo-ligase
MNTAKEDLRQKQKAKRLGLNRNQVEELSRRIVQKLILQTDWHAINNLHVYSSLSSLNEVQTFPLLEYLKVKHSQIGIFIEAQSEPKIFPDKMFDLTIVPVLAFDKENYRLGWGGGYYDKFLATQPQTKKIGLSFESGFVKDGLPHEKHDIPLDLIITESNIHTRNVTAS